MKYAGILKSLMCLGLVAALTGSAWALPTEDFFSADIEGDNLLGSGGGSGWNGGDWIYYDQTGWWNQWFYDDPPDPQRWKLIEYDIWVEWMPTEELIDSDVQVAIALNWSTPDFPETGPAGPPPMPNQEQYIMREVIYEYFVNENESVNIQGEFEILDYNPEWVSIDVMANAWGMTTEETTIPIMVRIDGTIWHECIPEPATMSLLAVGGVVALLKRKRKS